MSEPLLCEKTAVFSHFSVPRGTRDKLERLVHLVCKWNTRFNLISQNTIPDIWARHVFDSAQLVEFVPENAKKIVDLGSGAGFPGLVLAIMAGKETHLVESIGKKARFLQTAIDDLALPATVHNARIESIKTLKGDVVTARALKPLPELLGLAKPFAHDRTALLFLKGQKADAELTEARKYWTFACEKHLSLTDPSGSVLKITGLKAVRAHGAKHLPRRAKRQM